MPPRSPRWDVASSYDFHANAHVTKPVDFDQFVAAVRQIDDFYFTVVSPAGRRTVGVARPRLG